MQGMSIPTYGVVQGLKHQASRGGICLGPHSLLIYQGRSFSICSVCRCGSQLPGTASTRAFQACPRWTSLSPCSTARRRSRCPTLQCLGSQQLVSRCVGGCLDADLMDFSGGHFGLIGEIGTNLWCILAQPGSMAIDHCHGRQVRGTASGRSCEN